MFTSCDTVIHAECKSAFNIIAKVIDPIYCH